MNGVELRNIDKGYGHVRVLKDLSLDMAPGSFTVLLGPSGCGKSTLLACIAGLDEVDAGTIRIGPRDVTELEPKDRRIAMVFQSYALYPTMSVRRNMSFGLEVARMPRAEIDQRVARAASILQLEPLLDRKPAQLSGGQRQRAAIGRALVRDADVFLFDEPLSNLDAKLRVEMRMEIKRLHERLGTTMIYVTHDQVEAMTLASMIAVMNGGVIEQVADPQTLYDRPETLFVARFVGSPAMSLIEGRMAGDAVEVGPHRIPVDGYRFSQRVEEGRPVVLGVRPERVGIDGRANGAWPVSLPVDITEPMGADTLAWFDLDGQRLAARLDPEVARGATGRIDLAIDLTNASLFDQGSGHRL